MKIQTIDYKTNKPVTNYKIQLQIKGRDSGYLSTTTDSTGTFELDDKYEGQQITAITNSTPGEWTTVSDNATLKINTTTSTTGSKTTESAGTSYNK